MIAITFMERISLPKECVLRRMNEKIETEKDEAYYLQKIEDLRKKSAKSALIDHARRKQ